MATFRKVDSGKWRAEVVRRSKRVSKVHPSKRAAQEWAARQEYLIIEGAENPGRAKFGEVLQRYANEVSPTKRGEKWEIIRIGALRRDTLAAIPVGDLAPRDIAAWRDRRLAEVSPASVAREMQLVSAVLTIARREWGMIRVNPAFDVTKPKKPPPRDRLPTDEEVARLLQVAGANLEFETARAVHAFRFALETGMRAGEIVGLTWDRVNLSARVARLDRTKNGTAREVPLSSEAVRLIEALPRANPVFGIGSQNLDVLFRRMRDKAAISGLTFHDSRHAAITRLSKKLDVLELARMVGHRNLNQLLTYYNAPASEIAKKLD